MHLKFGFQTMASEINIEAVILRRVSLTPLII